MKEQDIRDRNTFDNYLKLVKKDCKIYFGDKSNFREINCPACNKNEHLKKYSKNGFFYVTCKNCQTLYVVKRPPIEKLKEFYADSVSSVYWVNNFFKPFIEARREKIFRPRAEFLVKTFGSDKKMVIGDIGAGFGLFLEELRKFWPRSQFIAIEPSIEQSEICKKLNFKVENCLVEELKDYKGCFDLLIAFELFEHLFDPINFLKKVYRLLKPGGIFFMTSLNGQGFDIQVLGKRSKSISPPHHLNFLNVNSLSSLLKQVGFSIKEISTPGRLDWSIVEGMILNENIDAGNFWNKLAREGTPEAKEELQNWIMKNKLSSHMRVLAKKNV